MNNPLKNLVKSLLRKPKTAKRTTNYGRNTAVLNNTPKNHKPSKRKIVQK